MRTIPRLPTFLPLLLLAACGPSRTGVLVPHGEPELVLMDFSRPFPLSPLPDGWYHRTFWTRRPMAMSFATKDGVPALRAETEGTASMLFRHVDVPLADYPVLTWRWYVERPITSPLDERTRPGDDHPARLFLAFSAASAEHRMEIVWGNRLHAGEWKFIEGFPHYVADGGDENAGRWRDERVDLRALYASLWPDSAPARLTDIAVFCDSDETGGHTVSYTAAVTMHREAPVTLNVALLGYDYAGKTFHAPLIAATPGLNLAAVASSDPAKVRSDLPDVAVLPDAAAVLAQPHLDLVVIATPNDTHADLARRALAAGRHVVVDEPFTLTLAEAKELAEFAASTGRVLAVFHNRRWDADFLTLRRLVADGALGEVLALESRFDRFRPQVRQRWREAATPGGGLWYDLGPHLVDQALRLFGPPEAIYADLALQRPDAEAVDYCHVLLRYPHCRVVLHASMLVAADSPRFAAHGLRGSYLKHGLDPQEDALKRGERPGAPGWGRDPRPGLLATAAPDGTVTTTPVPGEPGDYPAFYAGVRDTILGQGPNPVPPGEAVAVMAVLELALESARQGRELAFAAPGVG